MASGSASVEQLAALRVLAHPLRLRMLSLLTGCACSAAELGRELGVSQALASYHLRQLHAAGVVQLAEIRPRRGGREKRFIYRPPSEGESAQAAPSEDLALFAEALCVELRRRVAQAQAREKRLGVDAELWVHPDDWESALQTVKTASTALHEAARHPRAPGSIRVSMTALLFCMTLTDSSPDGDE